MIIPADDEEAPELEPLPVQSVVGAQRAPAARRVAPTSGSATDRDSTNEASEEDEMRRSSQRSADHGHRAGSGEEEAPDDDGDTSAAARSSSDSVEDHDASPAGRMRRVCWRLPVVGGRCRWVVAGPVMDHCIVDPLQFSMAIIIEGLPTFSCREAYARSVPILIKKGMYASVAAAHESIMHVADEHQSSTSTSIEPSWRTGSPDGVPIRRVLDRAFGAVRRSGGRVDDGFVKFVSVVPLASHPWYAYQTRLRARRDERRGAIAYRRALSTRTDDDERRLLRAGNSSALFSVRQATTYNARTSVQRAQGLRPTKKRAWRGVGAPDVIPARKRLIDMKRRVFEQSSRARHSMITLGKDGEAVVWAYVRGSGLTGVRLYRRPDGTIKRLASHTHKQRKPVATMDPSVAGGSGAEDAAAPAKGSVGAHASSTPQPGGASPTGADGAPGLSDDPFGCDSALGDAPAASSAEPAGACLTLDELRILRSSTLENSDGSDAEVILAVEFDIVTAMQAAIARRTVQCTVEDVVNGNAAWSMGSDGGPLRRSAITLFSVLLSASWLFQGRTAMLPVIYILAGEHHMHSCLGDRLDALLTEAVTACYEVRVRASSSTMAGDGDVNASGDSGVDKDEELSIYDWTGPPMVRIVGDFSMLAHIMGMTGGSDDSRCPFWWPCAASGFLSLLAHAAEHGRRRTVEDVGRQWELVCWLLARWSFLRTDSAALDGGTVAVRCAECRAMTPLSSQFEADFQCAERACGGTRSRAFDPILPTPLTVIFNLVRRRAGGVRGYPVIRSVPIVLQVPVLHCTGNIMKKLNYFFLADLGDGAKATAKQGMYNVTGRASLKQLYLREHIKLAALIVACEEIVGVEVDSAVLSMWSLALLLTASWRRALDGPMQDRGKCVAVMELATGLLAPLWSALKPLDKESKGTGVTSLYLHAALVHARDSMADNSPAEAVITDDHVEGALRDVGKYCDTRLNNVARAQAVTEYQALADDDASTKLRNRFAAELVIHTERIEVCGCCSKDLAMAEVADIGEAVRRAGVSGVVGASVVNVRGVASQTLQLPASLVHRHAERGAQGDKTWASKEERVGRALAARMREVKVCLCGAAWNRGPGPLGQRLAAVRRQGADSALGDQARAPAPDAEVVPARRPAQPAPVVGGTDTGTRSEPPGAIAQDEARVWMQRHSSTCLASSDDCAGACVETGDGVVDGVPDDEQGDAGGGDSEAPSWAEQWPSEPASASRAEECTDKATAPQQVPFLAADVFNHPTLRPFVPPLPLLKVLLGGGDGSVEAADVDADECRSRLDEEDMLLRIFLLRMRDTAFVEWASAHGVHLNGMRAAVTSVLHRSYRMRASLPGANKFTI